MKYVDNFLNGITMYKLVLYGLFILTGLSILFAFIGLVSFSGLDLIYSFLTLTIVCFVSNELLGRLFKVQLNVESSSITTLILFLICFPISTFSDFKITVLAGLIAMVSKYVLAIKKKHIFNPAAVAILILGFFGFGIGLWWVATPWLFIPTLVLGILVVRKVRRFSMFFTFVFVALTASIVTRVMNGYEVTEVLSQIFTSWPILFLGTIMLTEPFTTPPTRKLQVVYGGIVGLLFGLQFHFGPVYSTPELALIIGNIFAYIVSPKIRAVLTLKQKNQKTPDVYDFVFESSQKFNFKPGQYLEWTLGHDKVDVRGNRRYFTIASSPTEDDVILGTKFYPNPSTFKQKLLTMSPGDKIIASELRGEFNMPKDINKKLVFIAGGIGVTPFRSMAKYMMHKNEKRDIVFFYSNKTPNDIAYKEIFEDSKRVGWKNIYVVNDLAGTALMDNMRTGFITGDMIIKDVPDYKDRIFYISGTHGMVSTFENTLAKLGVSSSNIKTDFFPGFV